MIKHILISLLVIVPCSAGLTHGAEFQAQTGINFDWWEDNRGGSGSQLVMPVTMVGRYQDVTVRLLTAYATTEMSRGSAKTSITDFLDTKLGVSYLLSDRLPVDILFGLDFNLPSGKTSLGRQQTDLVYDPDLFTINNFGEGFNVNPTITIAKDWKNWIFSFGLGYLWRGSYDFSSELELTDYKPGEIVNATGEIRYYFTSDMFARLFGSYSWYTKDTLHGVDFFQEGNVGIGGAGFTYAQAGKWDASLTFRGIMRDSVMVQASPGVLVKEQGNIHGDEFVVDLIGRYVLDQKTSLSLPVQFRMITSNDYPSWSGDYIGERDRVSLGVGVTRQVSPAIMVDFTARGFYKHDDPTNQPTARGSIDYSGFTLTALLTGSF